MVKIRRQNAIRLDWHYGSKLTLQHFDLISFSLETGKGLLRGWTPIETPHLVEHGQIKYWNLVMKQSHGRMKRIKISQILWRAWQSSTKTVTSPMYNMVFCPLKWMVEQLLSVKKDGSNIWTQTLIKRNGHQKRIVNFLRLLTSMVEISTC